MSLQLKATELHLDYYGIVLAVLSAICYATYITICKKRLTALDPLLIALGVCFGCTIVFFMISSGNHTLVMPTALETWGYMLGFSFFCTVLPMFCFIQSLRYISAVKAAILGVLAPVIIVVIGVVVLGESLTLLQAIGAAVILSGAILAQLEKAPQNTLMLPNIYKSAPPAKIEL
jgi:drug/metabolite transporter (DMT)-like permease